MGIYYNSTDHEDADLLQNGIDSGQLIVLETETVGDIKGPTFSIYYDNKTDFAHKLWYSDPEGNIHIRDYGKGKLTRMGEVWLINRNHSSTY
jgi:hypothetical protein